MIQKRFHDKEKEIQGLKKQTSSLLTRAWEKGYVAGFDDGYETGRDAYGQQGEPIIKCKDCKYQVKEWRVNRRIKEKGYWAYGCKHFGEIMGYWGFGGDDNEFCSDAEIKEAENDNP